MTAFIILLVFEVVRNSTLIVWLDRYPNHNAGTVIRTVIVFFACKNYFGLPELELTSILQWSGVSFLYGLSCAAAFWFSFDVLLNKSRGLAWNYLGENADLDKGTKKIKNIWLYKAILMVIGLVGILLIAGL